MSLYAHPLRQALVPGVKKRMDLKMIYVCHVLVVQLAQISYHCVAYLMLFRFITIIHTLEQYLLAQLELFSHVTYLNGRISEVL